LPVAVLTMRVFRADERWARWFVNGAALLLVAGVGGSALEDAV
jgi:hypothetical protein